MKAIKTIAATASISLTIGFNPMLFSDVSHHFHEMRTHSQAEIREPQINNFFVELENMAVTVEKINTQISENLALFAKDSLPLLEMVAEIVNTGIDLAKQYYQAEILSGTNPQYRQQFRALTSANFRFTDLMRTLKERLYGFEVVSLKNVTLTTDKVKEINAALVSVGGSI